MKCNTRHDLTTFSTSDLTSILKFEQNLLTAAKVAITKEADLSQVAAYAESIADYAAGIDRINKELAAR